MYIWNKTQYVVGVPGKNLTLAQADELRIELGLTKVQFDKLLTANGEFTKEKATKKQEVE